jgi:hypothetical protein
MFYVLEPKKPFEGDFMRTQRTKALLAALGALLLAAVGVLLAPGAASAAPDYPPPPSTVQLSSGTVRAGNSVGVYGSGFGAKEPVIIQVRVRPRDGYWFARQGFTTHTIRVWTNKNGEFKTRIPTYVAGTTIVVAHGLDSGEDGKAKVRVLGRSGPRDYGDRYDDGVPAITGGLPGMQAVHNTVGRWLANGRAPGWGVGWRAM